MAAWRFLTTSTLCAAKAAVARRCGCRGRSLAWMQMWARYPPTRSRRTRSILSASSADPVHLDDDHAFAADIGQVDEH